MKNFKKEHERIINEEINDRFLGDMAALKRAGDADGLAGNDLFEACCQAMAHSAIEKFRLLFAFCNNGKSNDADALSVIKELIAHFEASIKGKMN